MQTVAMLHNMDMLVLRIYIKLQQPAKGSLNGDFVSCVLVYAQPGVYYKYTCVY